MYQKFTSTTSSKTNNSLSCGDFPRETKPCLVESSRAEQGFSVLYQGKFLYSKYSPKKSSESIIDSLQVLDGTVYFCFSPVLLYGIKNLLEKAENCGPNFMFFLIEKDTELFALMKSQFETSEELKSDSIKNKIALLTPGELENLPSYLWKISQNTFSGTKIPDPGTFKRIIPLNMSAGTQLNADFYTELFSNSQNVIQTFWKNRATLIKLGRLYSKNLLKNLTLIEKTEPLENFFSSVNKTILVLGAGPSLNETVLQVIEKGKENFFVVAVDAALPVLSEMKIKADCVVAVESQLAIEKCYIGCIPSTLSSGALIFSDLTSRYSLNRKFFDITKNSGVKLSFFSSDYTESRFFKNLSEKGILPYKFPAMGSVGLTAVSIALKLRASDNVNIFVSGLDFSYNLDSTHAKGTWQNKRPFLHATKLNPAYFGAVRSAFGSRTVKIEDNGKILYSDPSLLSYAENFKSVFKSEKNLFNCGKTGVNLSIENKNLETQKLSGKTISAPDRKLKKSSNPEKYLKEEIEILLAVKNYLTTGDKNCLPKNTTLQEILEQREYLYLHFPDGHLCRASDIDFLKRVRTEIDWVLKILTV